MNCAWRWCSRALEHPHENVFCSERHARKWARLHDSNPPAAMQMLRQSGVIPGRLEER